MGRPREHDESTAAALLAAAEQTIQEQGIGALTLRDLARSAGTTTRAVYSLFGSKDALLGALGARAFELLREGVSALPASGDPCRDLVEVALMFRRFALDHPVLFSIGIQRADPAVWPQVQTAAAEALTVLHERFTPLAGADLLGGRTVGEAVLQFHALCEGMAALELRGVRLGNEPERWWRNAFDALITGFSDQVVPPSAGTKRITSPR